MNIERMAERAFIRGNSPWRFADFWRWLCNGEATLYVTDHLAVGMWWTGSLGAEIAFVCGEWDKEDAETLFGWVNRDADNRGFSRIEWNGRASWPRYLRMRGIKL